MPVFDLFSKRQKRLRGDTNDVFTYDEIPQPLRVQIVHIWRDAIDSTLNHSHYIDEPQILYKYINDILCREYGVFQLIQNPTRTYSGDIASFFLSSKDNEKVLDVIELVFRVIDVFVRHEDYQGIVIPRSNPDDAINELNERFLEHGIGYQYESGILIRKDSELLHAEVVKPTLIFLNDKIYKGANEEFLKAHEHYRLGRYKECLNECLKAFESTMKSICHKRSWPYNQNDTAKKLIEICFANGLVPSFLQSEITALKSVLESGIPTVRNKLAGHGQGSQQTIVPSYMTSYMLHLTATTILFLIQAEKELP